MKQRVILTLAWKGDRSKTDKNMVMVTVLSRAANACHPKMQMVALSALYCQIILNGPGELGMNRHTDLSPRGPLENSSSSVFSKHDLKTFSITQDTC